METSKKRWSELTPGQRMTVVLGALVQLTLMVLAQRDIAKRPAAEIRGPKPLWRMATLVNFVGPLAYFCCGRKKAAAA